MSKVMSIRLDKQHLDKLDHLTELSSDSRTQVLKNALDSYFDQTQMMMLK